MVGKRSGFWGSCSCLVLGALSQAAYANSTFDTGPGEAVNARAHLDFTINIPLVLTLERPAKDRSSKVAGPQVSVTWDRNSYLEPFSATANGGTLSITPLENGNGQTLTPSMNAKAYGSRLNRGYLVAMP